MFALPILLHSRAGVEGAVGKGLAAYPITYPITASNTSFGNGEVILP